MGSLNITDLNNWISTMSLHGFVDQGVVPIQARDLYKDVAGKPLHKTHTRYPGPHCELYHINWGRIIRSKLGVQRRMLNADRGSE